MSKETTKHTQYVSSDNYGYTYKIITECNNCGAKTAEEIPFEHHKHVSNLTLDIEVDRFCPCSCLVLETFEH